MPQQGVGCVYWLKCCGVVGVFDEKCEAFTLCWSGPCVLPAHSVLINTLMRQTANECLAEVVLRSFLAGMRNEMETTMKHNKRQRQPRLLSWQLVYEKSDGLDE